MEKATTSRIISGIISVIILLAGGAGFWFLTSEPEQKLNASPQPPPPTVETISIEPHPGELVITVDGVVVPYREIDISAEVAGRVAVKSERCRAGSFVERGTLLMQIDPRDYEFEVRRLTSQLEEADANIEELEVEITNTAALTSLAEESLTLARNEVRRLTSLATVVSQSDLDRAKREEVTARNSVLTLKNQDQLLKTKRNRLRSSRELVETQLEKAQLDLERTRIVAPVDGVVVTDHVEQDDFVSKGTPLMAFEDTSAVEVKCNLRMDELFWLRAGERSSSPSTANAYQIPRTPVAVVYQLPQSEIRYVWTGELTGFDGLGLDEKTRTVACRVEVPQPREGRQLRGGATEETSTVAPPLVRGMYVSVELHLEPPGTLIRLPERAVRPGKTAWVVRDGKLEIVRPLRLIELIAEDEGSDLEQRFWIADAKASRLNVGDPLIVSPLVAVYEGMPVREQTTP